MPEQMTYADVGVDYDAMDPFKRQAQRTARQTAGNLTTFDFTEVEWSRGESAYLIETPWGYLAHVQEGLGTKNLAADAVAQTMGIDYYAAIAQDAAATIVNDIITVGAMPVSLAMHLAVGSYDWFKNDTRTNNLVTGWKMTCDLAGCVWACGETSTLKGIIEPGTAEISGSAIGIIQPKEKVIVPALQPGDAIVLLASSGIHANGLTMAREIADKLPDGYKTKVSSTTSYGDALLQPTIIYVSVVRDCLAGNVDLHYASNITGHGMRKLMRATEPFVYVIDKVGDRPPLFTFMQEHGPITDREAYANFNMGAGFALYITESAVDQVIDIAQRHGIKSWRAGHIEKHGEEKKVVIKEHDLTYDANTLAVR